MTYTNGLAAPGGSVAIRILGASTAIDAVGWGTAANPWMEGTATVAPAAGHSIERLPGGSGGSGQDTNENSADFVERAAPDPQNTASPPIAVPTPHHGQSHGGGDAGDDADAPRLPPPPPRPRPRHADASRQSDANRDAGGDAPATPSATPTGHAGHARSPPRRLRPRR